MNIGTVEQRALELELVLEFWKAFSNPNAFRKGANGPKRSLGVPGLTSGENYIVEGHYSKKHGYRITGVKQLGQDADARRDTLNSLLVYGLK